MIKKFFLKIVNIVSVILIIFSVFVLLTVVTTKKGDVPRVFGYSLFRVMTGSMEPTMPIDSLILVKQTEPAELREQDVISFFSRDPALMGEVNTHRIIKIEQYHDQYVFYTKGDANNIEDRYETFDKDIVGKVVFSSLFMGKAVRLISNPLIFIPLIIIPLMIIVGRNLVKSIRLAKQIAKEEEEAAVREAVEAIKQKKKEEEVQHGRSIED